MDKDCVSDCEHPIVVVKGEHRMSARFSNPGRGRYTRYRLDGCLQETGTAADWAVCEQDVGLVVIELKGVNVEHGAKQVGNSVTYMRSSGFSGRISGLIVATQIPRAAVLHGKMQREFYRKHRCHLHLSSSKNDFVLSELLAA